MLSDLAEVRGSLDRESEVCIIGAGAAGLTIARRLLGAGHQVVLLESGGRDFEAPIADLNAGENVGEPYYPLDHARLRFFGGTTAIWGGRCAELDPFDFQAKPWVPDSGWPFPHEALRPYYDEAWRLFGRAAGPAAAETLRAAGVPLPRFDPDRLVTPVWAFDNRFNRFAFESCRDLVEHPRCEVVLHATATAIEAASSGRGIERVVAKAHGGATMAVRARTFILAAGGIENPRLLLASNALMPEGLGNAHDLVGRFFMEHPHARGGRILDAKAWQLLMAFGRRHRIRGEDMAALIALAPGVQAERGALNSSLVIVARQPERAAQFWGMRAYSSLKHDMKPTRSGRSLWMATKRAATWGQRVVDPLRPWLLHKTGKLDLALLVRAEQAPNRDSRVTLGGERDALGLPRARLDWRLSPLDVHSVAVLVETLRDELARLALGRVEAADWLSDPKGGWRTDPLVSSHPIGGYHHMGTTRMAEDPHRGVTDGRTRVHGIGNLYVAGSSLFPTSGWANPTLTIVALALRTADEVSRALGRPAAVAGR
ncbi:MAG TPA: GMC family oxidoreductase [Allosphingosinicella sp.]|nr:GMC family oxidoreductase [Allosphingosinicella sp.]